MDSTMPNLCCSPSEVSTAGQSPSPSKVRIYHGFGDGRIRLLGKEFNVAREDVVRLP